MRNAGRQGRASSAPGFARAQGAGLVLVLLIGLAACRDARAENKPPPAAAEERCRPERLGDWEPLPEPDFTTKHLPRPALDKAFQLWSQKRYPKGSHLSTRVQPLAGALDAASARRYRLGKSSVPVARHSIEERYTLLDAQERRALALRSCAEFNLLHKLRGQPWNNTKSEAIERALEYLSKVHLYHSEGRRCIASPGGLPMPRRVQDWAAAQPGGPKAALALPEARKSDEGGEGYWWVFVRCWDGQRGLVVGERLRVDVKGRIVNHRRQTLAELQMGKARNE